MATVTTAEHHLVYPVTVEGREYTILTFRRMKAKDALAAEGVESQARAGYLLYATLAGVDVAVIEELDIDDLTAIAEKVVPLMGKSAAQMPDSKTDAPSSGAI